MSLLSKPTAASEAWVLRTWPCGETSVIASLLTRDYGYIRVMAKGARGARSLLRPLVDPGRLVHAEFSLDPDRDLQYLRSGSVLLDCLAGAPTLEGTAYLLAALELADRCRPTSEAEEDHTAAEVFVICEEFLRVLSSEACGDPALLFFAFEWELLQRHGMAPEVVSCASCGDSVGPADTADGGSESRPVTRSVTWFSPADGGLVCARCMARGEIIGGKPLQQEALQGLRRLNEFGMRVPMTEPLERGLRRQLGTHLHHFLGYHMPGYRLPTALELLRAGKDSTR